MSVRRKAAVAVAIMGAPPYGVVFVERAAHLRDHPGQIGLPGGRADPEDGGDLRRTVLREICQRLEAAAYGREFHHSVTVRLAAEVGRRFAPDADQ